MRKATPFSTPFSGSSPAFWRRTEYRGHWFGMVCVLAIALAVACSGDPAVPTAVSEPAAVPTSEETATPLLEPTSTPTSISTATSTAAPTAPRTIPPTPAPSSERTLEPMATPVNTPAPTPLATPTDTPTPALMATPMPVATVATGQYYTQVVDAGGIPVKASAAVAPEALVAATDIVRRMLSHRPDIATRMEDAGASLAIVPRDRYITEIPELAFLKGRIDPNGNPYDSFTVRGAGGISGQTTTVTSEENLLGLEEDNTRFWAEDITVHEFAHAIENLGFDDATRSEWLELFHRAREAGLWPDAFGMMVDGGREFFAEMSQSYLGVNNEIGGPMELYGDGTQGVRVDIFAALEAVYGPVNLP